MVPMKEGKKEQSLGEHDVQEIVATEEDITANVSQLASSTAC